MLNYDEASALAYQLARYMILCTVGGPLLFLIGWRLLVNYLKGVIEDDDDIDITVDTP